MEPVISSIIFYGVVICFCELCRRSLDVLYGRASRPPRSIKGFLTEAIGTLQAIACVYENQLILKNYGLLVFGLTAFVLLNLHRLTNRGAITSPPALIERTLLGHLKLEDAAAILLAELTGALLAFRLASMVWRLGISPEQLVHAETFECVLLHKVPLAYVAAYEFTIVFLIRTFVGFASRKRPYWTPYVAAASLSIGIPAGFALIGPVALNPIVAFGRLGGCHGMTWYEHFITYWAAPTLGWLTAWISERILLDRGKKVR